MKTTNYPSDLTDEQFALLEPLLPPAKPGGRPREVNLHDIIDGILYVNRTGCQWRALPHDYPPWSTVYHYFRTWRNDETWQLLNETLRPQVRVQAGRPPTPQTAYIDSQSVKSSHLPSAVGYDPGKKISGRKRHIVVDSMGLLMAVLVTAASVPDAVAAEDALAMFLWSAFPRLRRVWADTAYATRALLATVASWGQRWTVQIVRRAAGVQGWVLLPKRWVVERTFGWLIRYRRHSRDYEQRTQSSEAMIYISMIDRMVHRLKPERGHHRFYYRKAG